MEVVIDSCIFINAIFQQLLHEDCFRILRFVYEKDITPVVSEEALSEYLTTPQRMARDEEILRLNNGTLTADFVGEEHELLADYSICMSRILADSRFIDIVSNTKYCVLDHEDDKWVNIAIDAGCPYIITHNVRHIDIVERQGIRTSDGQAIRVFTPDDFYTHFMTVKLKQKMQIQRR